MNVHLTLRDQFPGLPHGEEVLFAALVKASKPIENLTITEHAERYRVVSDASGSPWPGPFRISRVPYLREPQDCLHPDHPARRVTARWAAQLGKSTAIENWFAYVVDQAPGSMMIVLPTLEEAIKFNRVKLQPTIEASPRIRHKVMPVSSRDEQGSTTSFKRYAGGFCQIVNAGSSKGLQMVSIKYLAMDEITGYPRDVDGRGSPRDQARARQKMYGDLAKEWQGSTPGEVGECAITEDFDAGDRRYLYVPCPHCGAYHPLKFEQMRGADEAAGLPAHFRCLACDGVLQDGHKADLLAGARWIATRVAEDDAEPVPEVIKPADLAEWLCEPCEGRCRNWQPSYHLWAAYAPRERWHDIWGRWTEAQGDTTKMRTFSQQDLALPYDPGGEAIDWEKIVEATRGTHYPRSVLPAHAALIISTADVQSYGIKWAAWAVGPRDQMWLLDREVFEGSPDQSDEPWIALADALGRTYKTGGVDKGIDLSGVDSGYATNRVYMFCRSRPNVFALDGRPRKAGAAWLGSPTKQTVKDMRGRAIAKALLYPVYSFDIKSAIMAGLANLVAGTNETGAWPRNTMHLTPELADEAFIKELTAERLVDPEEEARNSVKRRARHLINPHAPRQWKQIVGRPNDWLDVAVYAKALAWHLQHRLQLTEQRWVELLLAVHGEPKTEDLFETGGGPFEAQQREAAAQVKTTIAPSDWI
ncbi:terminase gpA endonuclease subunit [Devosia sp. XGJD_8]|uniref:terminase gpA endonuclease subunit n=1 Tax=Devosia sp. XGJD_8 TaxID=3391187 RepID=UPI0039848A63